MSAMQTVFVDATRRPFYEIARDCRDPHDAVTDIERVADAYSRNDRLVRVFATGQYVTPWRKSTPLYESRDGSATPDFRS